LASKTSVYFKETKFHWKLGETTLMEAKSREQKF